MTELSISSDVNADHPCMHCGYNLRGLPDDGKCPECFTPVARSLRGDLLKYTDPEWLDRLRFGTVLKLWNICLSIGFGVIAAIFVASGMPQLPFVIFFMLAGVLGVWASFAITTQEPAISLQEDPVTWRKAIRICAILGLVGNCLNEAGQAAGIGQMWLIAGRAISLVGVVTVFGELLYFSRFALRIPDANLARSTRVVMWGSAATLTCLIALGILVTVGVTAAGPGPATATATFPGSPLGMALTISMACIAVIPGLIFFVWYVSLLVRYKQAFAAAYRTARQGPDPAAQQNGRAPA